MTGSDADVVITGAGVISPMGHTIEEHGRGLVEGRLAIGPAPYRARDGIGPNFWGTVDGFDPTPWMTSVVVDGTDIFARWAIAAAEQARRAAGLESFDPRRTGIVHGTSMGGYRALLEAQHHLERSGPLAIPRKTSIKIWPNMAAAQISMRYGLHGPQMTVCNACASSIDALGTAANLIRSGQADVMFAGGSEGGTVDPDAPEGFTPVSFFHGARYGMTTPVDDITRASMPFDRDRAGIVHGEGSAIVVLERADHARARGAVPLAVVRGYGSVADASHPSSPDPSGDWERLAMELAVERAGLAPGEGIDVVFAHATGTPKGDVPEILALNSILAAHGRQPVVTSLKGTIGHTGASAGTMGVIAALGVFAGGAVPPTLGTSVPDPLVTFDVVTGTARDHAASVALVNAFGFGGQNASMVISAAPTS